MGKQSFYGAFRNIKEQEKEREKEKWASENKVKVEDVPSSFYDMYHATADERMEQAKEARQNQYLASYGIQEQNYGQWTDQAYALADQMAREAQQRKDKWQEPEAFTAYSQEASNKIDELLQAAADTAAWYEQYANEYDVQRGAGRAQRNKAKISQLASQLKQAKAGLALEQQQWSQFDSQEAFDQYLRQQAELAAEAAERQRLSKVDVSAVQRQIEALQKELDARKQDVYNARLVKQTAHPTQPNYRQQMASADTALAVEQSLRKRMSQLQSEVKKAQWAQTDDVYRANMDAKDFEEIALEGEAYKPANIWERLNGFAGIHEHVNDPEYEHGAMYYIGEALEGMADKGTEKYGKLTADEKAIFNYLTQSEGPEAAREYLQHLDSVLLERRAQKHAQETQEFAQERPGWASAASIAVTPYKGMGYVTAAIEAIGGKEIDPNAAYFDANRAQQVARGTVSQNIKDSFESEFAGNAMAFLYNTGMSVGDFLLLNGITAGMGGTAAEVLTLGFMGTGAASDATADALQRGATSEQALSAGFWAGAAEVIFEKISLDQFVKAVSAGTQHALIKTALRQAGIEASEEAFTEVANTISDVLVMGDLSNYSLAVEQYKGEGLSEAEAQRKALMDIAINVGLATLGGGLSGGTVGTVGGTVGRYNTQQAGKQIASQGQADALVQHGLTASQDSQLYEVAQEVAAKGGKRSNLDVGRVYAAAYGDAVAQNKSQGMKEQQAQDKARQDVDAMLRAAAFTAAENQEAQQNAAEAKAAPTTAAAQAMPGVAVQQPMERQAEAPATQAAMARPTLAQQALTAVQEAGTQAGGQPSQRAVGTPQRAVLDDNGAPVTVEGVTSVRDGVVTLRLSDGSEAVTDDLTFDDPSIDQLYAKAASFDTPRAAEALISGFDGTAEVEAYARAFTSVYRAAAAGLNYEQAASGSLYAQNYLSQEAREAAYAAGVNDARATAQAGPDTVAEQSMEQAPEPPATDQDSEAAPVAYQPDASKAGGVKRLTKAKLTAAQQDQVNALDVVFKALGRTVELVDSIPGEGGQAGSRSAYNAMFDPSSNSYTIALDSVGQAYLAYAVHESVHDVKANNAKGYARLESVVMEHLRAAGEDVDALVAYQKQLATHGMTEAEIRSAFPDEGSLTQYAREEVLANTVPVILTDPETGKAFAERFLAEDAETRTVFGKLLDSILDFLSKAYEVLARQRSWRQLRALQEDIGAITEIRETYFDALEGIKGDKSTTADAKERGSIKYDIENRPFVVVEEDILDGVPRKAWVKTVRDNLRRKFPNGIVVGNNTIEIDRQSIGEMTYSRYTQRLMEKEPQLFADKMRATNSADEVLYASRDYVNEAPAHPRKDNIQQFARGSVLLRVGDADYTGEVVVAMRANGSLLLYDLLALRPTKIQEKRTQNTVNLSKDKTGRSSASIDRVPQSDTPVKDSISQNGKEGAKRFSMQDVAEESDDLIAIHNLNGEQLEGVLDLGGFPMPSIALIRASQGHDKYGDVSIIFDRETIDPQTMRGNKVYGGDAWTPTFPRVEYDVPTSAARKIQQRVAGLLGDHYIQFNVQLDADNMQDVANRNKGNIAVGYQRNAALIAAYWKSLGNEVELVYTKDQDGNAEYDRYATEDKYRALLSDAEFEKGYHEWLDGLFDGAIASHGIRNNADPYTPSGNMRSFKALHWEYTLENIVRAMRGDTKKGNSTFGASGLFGIATKDYKSMKQIKADVGRLRNVDEATYAAAKDAYQDRLIEIAQPIASKSERNSFVALDRAIDALCDAARRGKTRAGIARVLQEYSGYLDIQPDTAEQLHALLKDISEMPTEYFEAKPERAVGLYEIRAVVMPEGKYGDIKDRLQQRHVPIVEYDSNTEGDRLRALNTDPVQRLRFSRVDDIPNVDVEAIMAQNEKYAQEVEDLKAQFKLTQGHQVSGKAVEQLARRFLKECSSSYDLATFSDNLRVLFHYLANAEHPVWEEVTQMGVGLAKAVLERSSALDTTLYEQYAGARDDLRNTRIRLTGAQRAEAASLMGSYRAYRSALFGSVNLTNDGVDLDVAWQELAEKYPELFDADAAEGDMPALLLDAVRAIKPRYVNPYGYDMDGAAYDLFLRLYDAYFDVPEVKTFADKKAAELAQVKARYAGRIEQIRKDSKAKYDAKLKALRLENLAKRQELSRQYNEAKAKRHAQEMARLRNQYKAVAGRYNEKLMEQRAAFRAWKAQDRAKRQESEAVRRYRGRIERNAKALYTWLTHPTDAKHVPEALRQTVADFLQTVDFAGDKESLRAAKWRERMQVLKNEMQKAESGTIDYSDFYADIDPDFIPRLDAFIGGNRDVATVADMDKEKLQELDFLIDVVKRSVTEANRLHANARYENVAQIGDASIEEMGNKKAAKPHNKLGAWADDFLNVYQLDSFSYFDQLGGAAKTILEGLRGGKDKWVRNIETVMNYVKGTLEGIDARKLSGKGAQLHTFQVSGGELKLTTAQIMELYLLNKREQARGHIYGGGIKPSGDIAVRVGKKTVRVRQYQPVQVNEADMNKIIGVLTSEQTRIADAMQRFLSKEAAGWGNEASMQLYGYRKFTEADYYPIRSDENYTKTQDQDAAGGLYALRNLGMTKATVKGANNPLLLGDIFDTFARHVDEMANYNAYVVPLSDAMKWFNYRDRSELQRGSVKQSIERILGQSGKKYFTELIKDINGMSADSGTAGLPEWLFRNAKVAAVGANLRVVLQQPTAYVRAAAMIDPKYLAQAVFKKSNAAMARKYSPIAQWKSWGFFDLNLGKTLRELIVGDQTTAQKLREGSLWLAGAADDLTFGTLWNACELEMQDRRPDLKAGTEAFNIAVGQRLSEVIDRTQVVDSVFHRSQLMRSKNGFTQLYTSFMGEPTKSYNMLRNAVVDYAAKKDKASAGQLVRVTLSFIASAVATAAAAALADAFRDEDEEKKWLDKYLSAFTGSAVENMNPLNLLPILKDVVSMMDGYSASRMDLRAVERVVRTSEAWLKYLRGESKWSAYKLIYQSASALSSLTGIPVGNLMRTFNSLYNTFSATGIDWESETGTQAKSYETLTRAILEGDTGKRDRLKEKVLADELKSIQKGERERISDGRMPQYADEASITAAARDAVDAGVAAVLMYEPVIATAYEHRKNAQTAELNASYKELQGMGFTFNAITRAINRYEDLQNAEAKNKEYDQMNRYVKENLFTAIRNAAASGDSTDVEAIYEELLATSEAKDPAANIKAGVTGAFKPEYVGLVERGDSGGAKRLARVLINQIGYSQDDLDGWVMADASAKMQDAIEAGDVQAANQSIQRQLDMGREAGSIGQSITTKYKPLVLDAYFSGSGEYNHLTNTLMSLALYDNYAPYYTWERIWGWIEDYFKSLDSLEK